MQDGVALERKTKEELKQIALGLEVPKVSSLKKEELVLAIREARNNVKPQPDEKKSAKKTSFRCNGSLWRFRCHERRVRFFTF